MRASVRGHEWLVVDEQEPLDIEVRPARGCCPTCRVRHRSKVQQQVSHVHGRAVGLSHGVSVI